MSNGKEFLAPKYTTILNPTTPGKDNGKMRNPPRMAEFGGFSKMHGSKGPHKNKLTIKKPGGSR